MKAIGENAIVYLNGYSIHCVIKNVVEEDDKIFYDVEVEHTKDISSRINHVDAMLFNNPRINTISEIY